MEEEWQKVDPAPVWNKKLEDGSFSLKEGDTLIGTFVSVEDNVGPNNSKLYSFKQDNGDIISVWGGAILDNRLKHLEIGEEVKITYRGTEKSQKTKREYHLYEVFHRKPIPIIND